MNNGNLTVWCAQHDTNSLAPVGARAYELPSKSGNESMGVVWFLMNWPKQTEAIQNAVKGAISWYKKNRLKDKAFSKTAGVVDKSGSSLWFRFYEVNSDDYFYCDRDGASTKTQDFMKISEERRTGYQWAGDYGSAILSTEAAYLEALEKATGTYVEPPPPAAMCGSDTCKTYIDGVNFADIKGVKETTNKGFVGEGYANVDNETGSYVTYGVTAAKAGKYTLYISFANGGSSARGYNISVDDKTLLSDGNMESTGAWTTWKTQSVEIELDTGYSEFKFVSTSKDGMANIDYIGWMNADLYVGKKELGEDSTTVIGVRSVQASPTRANRYYVDFGSRDNAAGVYLKKSNGKVFKVNGKR